MQTSKSEFPKPDPDHRGTILVVDDERGPRESLRMILSNEYRVITAENGSQALEILRTDDIDLVTVDLNMPGIKGDQLVGIIRDELPQIEIIIITGFGTLETAIAGIRRGVCDFLTKPFDVVQVNGAVSRALHRQQGRRRLVRFLEGVGTVLGRDRTAHDILAELEEDAQLQGRLRALLEDPSLQPDTTSSGSLDPRTVEFLELLAETIESRDPEMRGHARRVAFYAGLIADRMNLGVTLQQQARIAAFLHDLGKVGLPSEVILAGETFDSAQRSAVEQHPLIGERLIRPLGLPSEIEGAIRHHHERWDGTGYPDQLTGEEIPLLARIVCVADAFDAMVCQDYFTPARGRVEALQELQANAGTQFDAYIVKVICEIAEVGLHGPTTLDLVSNNLDGLEFAKSLSGEKHI
jgi:putative two-component system response regulator